MLKTWKELNSNGIDSIHNYLGSTEHENMYVVASQTRDSGLIGKSNFDNTLELLGGECEDVQVHRFGHWGCGWFEQIMVSPFNADKVKIAENIMEQLAYYPVLNDDDLSQREYDYAQELWEYLDYQERKEYCQRAGLPAHIARRKRIDCDLIEYLTIDAM